MKRIIIATAIAATSFMANAGEWQYIGMSGYKTDAYVKDVKQERDGMVSFKMSTSNPEGKPIAYQSRIDCENDAYQILRDGQWSAWKIIPRNSAVELWSTKLCK